MRPRSASRMATIAQFLAEWFAAVEATRYRQDLWMGLFQATSVSVDSLGFVGVMSMGRSRSLPFSNVAPARTRATRWGAFTARQRDLGGLDQLVGHGDSGRREPGPLVILLRLTHGREGRFDRYLESSGGVFDVRHEASRSLVLRGGRGYLQSSRRQSLRRDDASCPGGFTGLVA